MRRMGPEDRPTIERILRESDQQQEWLGRAAPEFPCFGVAEWDGRLHVSQHSGNPSGTLHAIGLVHDRDGGARVEVLTTRRDARAEARLMRAGTHSSFEEVRSALRDDNPLPPGRPLAIPVDGETVEFELWGDEWHWWAATQHAGRGVTVAAEGVPVADVRLARIVGLEPYFAYSDAVMRRMRDHLDDMGLRRRTASDADSRPAVDSIQGCTVL